MNLHPTLSKNHRLACLKQEKTRPSVSDSEVGKFSHASQTRASGTTLSPERKEELNDLSLRVDYLTNSICPND